MKRTNILWITALALGWLFDFLFWKHPRGINFAIYVAALPGRGLPGAGAEWHQAVLEIPAPAHPHPVLCRHDLHPPGTAEPVPGFAFTLGLMGLLAVSYLGGRWPWYSLSDYVVNYCQSGRQHDRPPADLPVRKQEAGRRSRRTRPATGSRVRAGNASGPSCAGC